MTRFGKEGLKSDVLNIFLISSFPGSYIPTIDCITGTTRSYFACMRAFSLSDLSLFLLDFGSYLGTLPTRSGIKGILCHIKVMYCHLNSRITHICLKKKLPDSASRVREPVIVFSEPEFSRNTVKSIEILSDSDWHCRISDIAEFVMGRSLVGRLQFTEFYIT